MNITITYYQCQKNWDLIKLKKNYNIINTQRNYLFIMFL